MSLLARREGIIEDLARADIEAESCRSDVADFQSILEAAEDAARDLRRRLENVDREIATRSPFGRDEARRILAS